MIQQNINRIKDEIGETTLIAVSKYRSIEELEELYDTGQRIFAENRVQELLKKKPLLPSDVEWHLIGHLQTNKVKSIVGEVSLIHSADSLKVLKEIDKQSQKKGIKTAVLLQIHVAQEESKFGFEISNLFELASQGQFENYPNVEFNGIMSMASLTDDTNKVSKEFQTTQEAFQKVKPLMPNPSAFKELSMGMSSDYIYAIEKGATMVRIGSRIFE